jgi:negative regulator of sigma E activity
MNPIKSNISNPERLSAFFDGMDEIPSSNELTAANREKWENYALISDVMRKNFPKDLYMTNVAEKIRTEILKEPNYTNSKFGSFTNWLKQKYIKLPVLVAAPAFALGLVVVLVQAPTDQIAIADNSEMPKIMDSYCQLHENGTGGAALC